MNLNEKWHKCGNEDVCARYYERGVFYRLSLGFIESERVKYFTLQSTIISCDVLFTVGYFELCAVNC